MNKDKNRGLSIRIKASGIILNPWYQLPPEQIILHNEKSGITEQTLNLIANSYIELPDFNINLYFNNDSIIFENRRKTLSANSLIIPIQYIIAYKTFINYNIIYPDSENINYRNFKKVNILKFKIGRIVRIDQEKKEGNHIIKSFYHKVKPYLCELQVESLINYLNVLNKTLYYAIASYLIGCENPRYFLVEFYKAVESIKKSFANENEFLQTLKKFGITKRNFKKFCKNCNDSLSAPLDIGRHAPATSAKLYSIDLRNLFVDPLSSDVFLFSTTFCRNLIDAYIKYLVKSAG